MASPTRASSTAITGPKGAITLAVLLAAVMAVLDISIVNVALSDIRASYAVPLDQIGWVSTSYMMANVVVIPMTGWLQRRFGFRRYYTTSILLFTAASALCGLAWDLPSLVLFRVIQGVGGGAIIPTSQAILLARYPRQEHTMAGALFGLASIMGPLLGPTIGGYIIEISDWHWIFYANVPIGIATAWLANRVIGEPGFSPSRAEPDRSGFVLLALGMASLQYVLEEGNRHQWWDSARICALAAIAVVALVTFVVHELETPAPLVDLRIFARLDYTAGTLINFIAGLALFSSAYLFSLFCGAVMRYTALNIGLVFLAAGTIQLVIMPLLGKFGNRVDERYILAVGVLLIAWSFWQNAHLNERADYATLVYPQMLRSIGLGFVFVSITVLTLSNLPLELQGNGTGLFNLTRELGGSVGTAWMGTLLDHRNRMHLHHLAEAIPANQPIAHEQLALVRQSVAGWTISADLGAAQLAQLRLSLQALVLAFNDCFLAMMFATAAGLLLVLALRPRNPVATVEGAH